VTEVIGHVSAKASTGAYVSAVLVPVPPQIKNLLVHIVEKNVNAVKFKILGTSRDGGKQETLKAETTIAKNGSTYETLTEPWLFIDVQIIDSVAPDHGSVDIDVLGN